EDFDTYIKGAIDCKATNTNKQNGCNHNNKHGNGNNAIEQYFRGVAVDIFYQNGNKEIYERLKEKLLDTSDNGHYASLKQWNN
ncbi:Mlp family lipoprotein, partial [Borreliella bavariensis]|uniref:Mlp family lipoprotein n=1 Tax=Borreliella bavariensis TaxID=664662 RepID=UPI001C00666B